MPKMLKNIYIFIRLKLDIEEMPLNKKIIFPTNNIKFVNFTLSNIQNLRRYEISLTPNRKRMTNFDLRVRADELIFEKHLISLFETLSLIYKVDLI